MNRNVVRVPLSAAEAARVDGRGGAVPASTWVVGLIARDTERLGALGRPVHLSRTDAGRFVSVSIPAKLRGGVERRSAGMPLADYVRGVIGGGGSDVVSSGTPPARPAVRHHDAPAPSLRASPWAADPRTSPPPPNRWVDEQPPGPDNPRALDGLLSTFRLTGGRMDPPIIMTRKYNFATIGRVNRWCRTVSPGKRLNVVVGYDPDHDLPCPMGKDETASTWARALDDLWHAPLEYYLLVTPTFYAACAPADADGERPKTGFVLLISLAGCG